MAIRGQCLICEEMFNSNNLSALPCGHVFHECIRKWFEHTDTPTCPTCGAFTATNQIVRRLFFNACDDQNVDELMVNLRETKFALSRAEKETQELKNEKKEVEDKLALELGNVASFGEQIYNQIRQLDEATNLQKELIGELCGEREELKILRKKESDSVLCIRDLEEQLRISKKNEDDSKLLIKDSDLRIKNLDEQLRISKKNENDSELLIKDLEEQLRISKKNENDLENLVKEKIDNLEAENNNLNRQVNEARNLQKKLTKKLYAERNQLRILKEKMVGEQLKTSKKMEDVGALVKSVWEVLNVLDKREADLKTLTTMEVYNTAGTKLRSVEEQLKNLKTKETDSGIS